MSLGKTAVLAFIGIVLAANVFAADRLITVEGQGVKATKDAVAAIEANGGYAKLVFPPNFIIADIPDGSESALLATGLVSSIHDEVLAAGDFARYGSSARHIVAAWNNVFKGQARQMGLDAEPSPNARPLINDADIMPDKDVLPLRPPGSKYYDVSEYMLGTAAIGVILPESNGTIDPNSEDWTQAQMDQVTSEIVSGLNWLVSKADWRTLTFYTSFNYQVPTGYEPITHASSEEALWDNQCFNAMGYGSAYPGYPYVNALRDSMGTDWGTVVFVINDINDGDGMFTDGRFGYTMLGGPKTVMTYKDDGWGIANMDAVLAHELEHDFYALDEYQDAGTPCTATSGYLNIENQNSEYPNGPGGCLTNVRYCIMRSMPLSVARICTYTKGQIGWNDTDNDSIPDILDTCPETTLNPYAPDPDTTQTPTYSGTATVTKLHNLNPNGKHNDITLNYIAKVEWRVDGGPWADAIPTDGAWGGASENYHFTSTPLDNGVHIFEARAYHTYGNVDSTPAVDTLTIDRNAGVPPRVTFADVSITSYPNPSGSSVEIGYSIPGEYGKSIPTSIKVFDVRGREVATLFDGMRSPGAAKLTWNGAYLSGDMVPSGIYFVELVTGDSRVVKKLVLAR
ncbi:MAG TPA: T9SS type A sorting domain-containing protein [bacterium]|nr:T9SS type A sorting domain-containing protein [bacterium]